MAKRSIQGSRVVVTGASSGIGRELTLQLGQARARLVLVARRKQQLQEVASVVERAGAEVAMAVGDITDRQVRQAALAAATDRFGGLDILVNNAGVSAFGRFERAGQDRLRRIMEVNFFAAVELTRQALPLLRVGRAPLVVNIGSILGYRALPGNSEYCASKFALRGFSEALRCELAGEGIDLLLVSPGATDTPFFDHMIEKTGRIPWAQAGAAPQRVVAATVRAIRQGRREIMPSASGRLLVWLNRLAPTLLDRWLRRYEIE